MKNTFGSSITLTLFGESHGDTIGCVLDGLAPGMPVDEAFVSHQLTLRRPAGALSTARVEADPYRIVSGVFNGRTTGTPLCILIPNSNTRWRDYTPNIPRPGHADYAAACKYHGAEDYRGGGHFSGRVTAPLVAAGAILIPALAAKGIHIGTHIASLAGISDRAMVDPERDIEILSKAIFPVLDPTAADRMQNKILEAKGEGDSLGGVLETCVIGLEAGLGEPWFDSVESLLSHGLFSIPGIKGVEFGAGFDIARMKGSEANDAFCMQNGRVITKTNHNGGINGGITNGMPLCFRTAVKPTPSIYKEQDSVDLSTGENTRLSIAGRHDPAIIHRARVVVDSITALVLADLLTLRHGTDFLSEVGER